MVLLGTNSLLMEGVEVLARQLFDVGTDADGGLAKGMLAVHERAEGALGLGLGLGLGFVDFIEQALPFALEGVLGEGRLA